MPRQRQPTHLAITDAGRKYFRQMAAVGFVNLPPSQQIEWDILHDLMAQGPEVKLSTFLTEGRDTILGRAFLSMSEGLTERYGKTLHQLIKQGHIKAYREEPGEGGT